MHLLDIGVIDCVGCWCICFRSPVDREDVVKKYETLVKIIIIIIHIINFTCHKEYRGSQKTLQPRSSRSRGVPCKNKITSS